MFCVLNNNKPAIAIARSGRLATACRPRSTWPSFHRGFTTNSIFLRQTSVSKNSSYVNLCVSLELCSTRTITLSNRYYIFVFAGDSITLYAKRAYAIAIPSVRLFVCLSHGWSKTVEVMTMQFSLYSNPIPLVFLRTKIHPEILTVPWTRWG